MRFERNSQILAVIFLISFTLIPISSVKAISDDGSSGFDESLGGVEADSNGASPLSGYRIAIPNAGNSLWLEDALFALGAQAELIPISELTVERLENFHLLWIPVGAAFHVDNGGKASVVLNYVQNGGGLILSQPNTAMTPQCLPYTFQILNAFWVGWPDPVPPAAATIADPNHCLTTGLTLDDMPDCFDDVGTVDPRWHILAYSGSGDPTLAYTTFGSGRVIVEMDAPLSILFGDITGDNPSLSDDMVERLVRCVARKLPVGGEIIPANTMMTIAPIIASIIGAIAAAVGISLKKKTLD